MNDVVLRTKEIRLTQFLKLARLAETGGQARALIAAGNVKVNEKTESRYGRRLIAGDVVSIGSDELFLLVPERREA